MTRNFARSLARWLVLVLLLAQWAVASHACVTSHAVVAGVSATDRVVATPSAANGEAISAAVPMPDCDAMDGMTAYVQDLPCAEHCKFGDQGDNPASSLGLLGGFPLLTHARPPGDDAALLQRVVVSRTVALTLSPPPHAILHCVRRT